MALDSATVTKLELPRTRSGTGGDSVSQASVDFRGDLQTSLRGDERILHDGIGTMVRRETTEGVV